MSHDEHPVTTNKQYFTTWCWLGVMTLLALGVGYTHMPEGLKGFLLVAISLVKIFLIASIFMHLKFERMNLVLITFSPLILSLILFFATFGESVGSPHHFLLNH